MNIQFTFNIEVINTETGDTVDIINYDIVDNVLTVNIVEHNLIWPNTLLDVAGFGKDDIDIIFDVSSRLTFPINNNLFMTKKCNTLSCEISNVSISKIDHASDYQQLLFEQIYHTINSEFTNLFIENCPSSNNIYILSLNYF